MSAEAAPTAPAALKRVPSAWTGPLQYSVAGWYLFNALWVVSLPFWFASTLVVIVYGVEALDPNPTTVPQDWVESTMSSARSFLWLWAIAFAPVHLLVAWGSWKRWTWMHFAVLALLLIGAVPAPFAAVALAGAPPARDLAIDWIFTIFGLVGVVLLIPMLIATLRYGPWACRRVSAA